MARSGDWVTPRLYGQPWFEKPILYYWLAAIGFRLNLPAEWAARLPSAFAALAAALAIGWLAYKHHGAYPAPVTALAPVLFATTVGAIGFARAATPDMLFSAFLALAMVSAATVLRNEQLLRGEQTAERATSLPLILFGGFLGFAVLAKGPAAIILAGGALAIWILATQHWRAAAKFFHPFALTSFCVIALPWYALCALRNPDFLRVFILQHNFERYLTPVFQHPQPFWFFIPITLLALLPWTVLLWPAAREGMRPLARKVLERFPRLLFRMLGCFSGAVLQSLPVQTAELHSARRAAACTALRHSVRGRGCFSRIAKHPEMDWLCHRRHLACAGPFRGHLAAPPPRRGT